MGIRHIAGPPDFLCPDCNASAPLGPGSARHAIASIPLCHAALSHAALHHAALCHGGRWWRGTNPLGHQEALRWPFVLIELDQQGKAEVVVRAEGKHLQE